MDAPLLMAADGFTVPNHQQAGGGDGGRPQSTSSSLGRTTSAYSQPGGRRSSSRSPGRRVSSSPRTLPATKSSVVRTARAEEEATYGIHAKEGFEFWVFLPQLILRLFPPLMLLQLIPDSHPRLDQLVLGTGTLLVLTGRFWWVETCEAINLVGLNLFLAVPLIVKLHRCSRIS